MSLQTILQIGKVFRQSKDRLKYYKYVKLCPFDKKEEEWPICLTIPVNDNFEFDWERMSITPENERSNHYYISYTTSNNDSSPKKYLFGDIFYSRKSNYDTKGKFKNVTDFGNFTFEKGDKNGYDNGNKAYSEIKYAYLEKIISSELKANLECSEKDQEAILKLILKSITTNQEVKITKKFLKYSSLINTIIDKKIEFLDGNELFKFHDAFGENKLVSENLMRYAPLFLKKLEDGKNTEIVELLNNTVLLKEEYLKWLLDGDTKSLKKLIKSNETFDNLTEESKNKLKAYANHKIFIHFKFNVDKSWQDYENAFKLISDKLNTELTDKIQIDDKEFLVPSKSIYRTLCSGDKKNDIQTPNFLLDARTKSFHFKSESQFEDFLHTGSVLDRSFRRLYNTDIAMFVFPCTVQGDKISSKTYDEFFFVNKDEQRLTAEPLIPFFKSKEVGFKKFDFVFADSSGNSTNELLEISGVENSTLFRISTRIDVINTILQDEYSIQTGRKKIFKIEDSLKELFGVAQEVIDKKSKNKYIIYVGMTKGGGGKSKPVPQLQSHLLKILPLIYSESYFKDPLLLPNAISRIELALRMGDKYGCFTNLKYALKFLFKIQNSKEDNYMKLKDSPCYQIGVKMGSMAKPLNKAIGSFEKSYVGLLSRRVKTLDMCIRFIDEIDEKLVIHNKAYQKQTSAEIRSQIANMEPQEYLADNLAFGFFEGYFKYEVKDEITEFSKRIGKLISDFEEKDELSSAVDNLKEINESINNNNE